MKNKINLSNKWMKRIGLFLLILILGATIGVYINRDHLLEKRVAKIIQAPSSLASLEDGLHVLLLGTGSPMPDHTRAGTSTVIIAGSNIFVVDAGEGSPRNSQLVGLDLGLIDAMFITHYHSDHIASLGEFMLNRWVGANHSEPLDIYGPPGVETVVNGFNQAYQLDGTYRTEHHGPEFAPPAGFGGKPISFDLGQDAMASQVILEQDGVRVTAFNVDHSPVKPAVGYKFEYQGRSVVVSGDTVYSESVLEQAKGADLLIHDALSVKMVGWINQYATSNTAQTVSQDIPDYHASPEDVAALADKAGVKHLVFNHLIPPLPSKGMERYFVKDAKKIYQGEISVGIDGMLFSLTGADGQIQVKSLMK